MRQEVRGSLINVISLLSLLLTFFRFIIDPNFETISLVLASLATVITLFVSKKRVERAERRYTVEPRQLFDVTVTLWGPPGSGKTWLCNAFGRSLEENYNKEIEGLIYRLDKTSHNSYSTLSRQDIFPTMSSEDHIFRFERARLSDKYSHTISSFQHYITIRDQPGGMAVQSFYESNDIHLAEFINSDVVLLALDLTYVMRSDAESSNKAREQYVEWVSQVIRVLEKDSKIKKYFAVCITKADIITEFYKIPPESLVDIYFGKEMVEVLENFKDKNRLGIFALSSVGFINNGKRLQANVDDTGELLNSDSWIPYRVEYPFFEAFEYIEKAILVDKFKERWFKRLTLKSRLKKYISYPKASYDFPVSKSIDGNFISELTENLK